jgi:uncharacterized membrane protein YdfJ with MMPL/SSD domain
VSGLPAGTEERQAASAAGEGFAPGILAPTVVLAFRATARFAVVLDTSPLGSTAIEDLDRLDERLPGVLEAAGLNEVEAAVLGQTAIARDTVEAVVGSSERVGAVVMAVNFVLLALFLRALVAPLYLLAASLLSVAATLGLTTYVFQVLLGHDDLTYYVPFAAGVRPSRLLPDAADDEDVVVRAERDQERPCARRSRSQPRAPRARSASPASRSRSRSPCSPSSRSTDSASSPS